MAESNRPTSKDVSHTIAVLLTYLGSVYLTSCLILYILISYISLCQSQGGGGILSLEKGIDCGLTAVELWLS